MGQKHLVVIFGSIATFLLITGIGYFIGYTYTWDQFKRQPKIGAEPLKMKLVLVVKDLAAGDVIDYNSVEERRDLKTNVALDAFSFSSDLLGRKAKWPLHKGDYISRHDLLPAEAAEGAAQK